MESSRITGPLGKMLSEAKKTNKPHKNALLEKAAAEPKNRRIPTAYPWGVGLAACPLVKPTAALQNYE